MKETLNIIKNDPWLEPFADAITGRHQYALNKEAELTNKGKQNGKYIPENKKKT